jgi:hypothetical protein
MLCRPDPRIRKRRDGKGAWEEMNTWRETRVLINKEDDSHRDLWYGLTYKWVPAAYSIGRIVSEYAPFFVVTFTTLSSFAAGTVISIL